jgi:hypothetical protein
MLAPLPYVKPKAKNPAEARALYEHKLHKKWPFLGEGYDWDDINEFRRYGKTLREDNKPVIRGITYDAAYFFLHSTQWFRGCRTYTFIHMIQERDATFFRPLMFTDFSEAYTYAYAHGCKVNKKPLLTMDHILEFMDAETEDIDMFVEYVEFSNGINSTKHTTAVSKVFKGGTYGRKRGD